VPEQEEEEVHAEHIRQSDTNANVPWTLNQVAVHGDAKPGPNSMCFMATNEDVNVGFQNTRAVHTPGVF